VLMTGELHHKVLTPHPQLEAAGFARWRLVLIAVTEMLCYHTQG
jgi:hypothetical protein